MRYVNQAGPFSACPQWELVGLETFCAWPPIVPHHLLDMLPDTFRIDDETYSLIIAGGELTHHAVKINPAKLFYERYIFTKCRFIAIDFMGEMTDATEWVPLKKEMEDGEQKEA